MGEGVYAREDALGGPVDLERIPFCKREKSCFCAWGAVWQAACEVTGEEIPDGYNPSHPAISKPLAALAAFVPDRRFDRPHNAIFLWNDQETTTAADVLALFDKTIAALEGEQP